MKFDRFLWKATCRLLTPILIVVGLMIYAGIIVFLLSLDTVLSFIVAIAMFVIPVIAIVVFCANDDAELLRDKDEYRRKALHRHDH